MRHGMSSALHSVDAQCHRGTFAEKVPPPCFRIGQICGDVDRVSAVPVGDRNGDYPSGTSSRVGDQGDVTSQHSAEKRGGSYRGYWHVE
jgi:hypothetical protein